MNRFNVSSRIMGSIKGDFLFQKTSVRLKQGWKDIFNEIYNARMLMMEDFE